jgi:DNA-binding beta-propeller fold protein YncE
MGRHLYVAWGDGVMRIDLVTLKVTPHLIPGKDVHIVVLLPGGELLATNGGTNTATISDANTEAILKDIPVGDEPDVAVYDVASESAFVVDSKSGDLAVVDVATRTAATRIAIGGHLEFAVVDGKGRLYVNVSDKPAIAVLDTRTLQVVARYPLPGCEGPSGLGLDPESGVLQAACANQKAIAVRAADGAVLVTVGIDRIADAVIFLANMG